MGQDDTGMDDRRLCKARTELGHALDALTDGHDEAHGAWGPGPVGAKLWRRDPLAARAFDHAAVACVHLGIKGRDYMIASMKVLAPAILKVLTGAK